MQIISKEDVLKAINLNEFGGGNIAKIIMLVLQIDKINQLYDQHYSEQPTEFLNSIINETGINYEIYDGGLSRIPKEGPFIIVANHPFGGIEGLILLNSILAIRPDFKVVANFLFQRIEPIKDFIFAVNPFETHPHLKSSYNGLRCGLMHLSNDHPLGIFPAGEVSAWQKDSIGITDRPWRNSILKLIKRANVPVIPVYFQGKNSTAFYLMGRIHPLLRTAKIPSEMLNKRNVKIKLRFGNPISVNEQRVYTDIYKYGQYLRSKTYALGSIPHEKEYFNPRVKKQETIADPVDKILLADEIDHIPDNQLLFNWQGFAIYCVPTFSIPNITKEIGRLREITFREVDEGTNHSFDLDKFDSYYHQLFIWNEIEHEIVGGYRIGKGAEILSEHGIKGFYIASLFFIHKKMEPMLRQSIELGRSFIVKKYQRKPLSLFLLWKGIFYFLQKNEKYRYLIGPVSISNNYSGLSKQVMVEFIRTKYFDKDIAPWITPRKPYNYRTNTKELSFLLENVIDLNSLDQAIKTIEASNARMPVLLKKYLFLGGKIASFNLDPGFNNCLDCLFILDLKEVPDNIIQSLSKEKSGKLAHENV